MIDVLFLGAIVMYLLLERVLEKRGKRTYLAMSVPFIVAGALLLIKAGVMIQGHESVYDPVVRKAIHIAMVGMAWGTLGTLELVKWVVDIFAMLRKLTTRPAKQ